MHERHTVLDHRSLECLFNSLFGITSKKHQRFVLLALMKGIHRCPVDSPHKGPVMGTTSSSNERMRSSQWLLYRYWRINVAASSFDDYTIIRTTLPLRWSSIGGGHQIWSFGKQDYNINGILAECFWSSVSLLVPNLPKMQLRISEFLANQSQQYFAHTTTALLSWHVQHIVVIQSLKFEELSIDI